MTARLKTLSAQFIKFCVVGFSGVIVNTIVMVILHKLHGGPEYGGAQIFNLPGTDFWIRYRNVVFILSFLVANVWNYQLNRSWTFKGTHRSWWSGFFPFLAAGSIGAVVGLILQILLTHPNSAFYLPEPYFTAEGTWRSRELWAQLIGVLFSTPVNFVVNKIWTFRGSHTTPMT